MNESYVIYDLFLDYRPDEGILDGLEVQAGVDDLADTHYRNSLDGDNARGRTIRLTVARDFGW